MSDKIKDGKEQYRKKLESKLAQNNPREVWNGMRSITGQGTKMGGGQQETSELNLFFNRFDDVDTSFPSPTPPTPLQGSSHLLLNTPRPSPPLSFPDKSQPPITLML